MQPPSLVKNGNGRYSKNRRYGHLIVDEQRYIWFHYCEYLNKNLLLCQRLVVKDLISWSISFFFSVFLIASQLFFSFWCFVHIHAILTYSFCGVCVYVSMYVLLIFLYKCTCIYKFLFRKGQAALGIYPVTSVRNWAIISLLLYTIIGNPQLIIVSTHHPWVKWQRYLCSHVIVLKHADKSRRLSL